MTTHPHLEGLIRKWREEGAENKRLGGSWHRTELSYAFADELEAALAALPGGGVEFKRDDRVSVRSLGGAVNEGVVTHRHPVKYDVFLDFGLGVTVEAAQVTTLPTPNPHEADQ